MEAVPELRAIYPEDKSRRTRDRLARTANGGMTLALEVVGGKQLRTRVPRKSLAQGVAKEEALAGEPITEDY